MALHILLDDAIQNLNLINMKERLKESAKSTNFWNNLANVISLGLLLGILSFVTDKESTKEIILAYLSGSGVHNMGNILAHLNKDKN